MVIIKKSTDIPDHLYEECHVLSQEIVDLVVAKLQEGCDVDTVINALIWACAKCIAPSIKKGLLERNAEMSGKALEKMILHYGHELAND